MTTELERFEACMEYRSCDRRPNHELGIWPQTVERWRGECPDAIQGFNWNWFHGEDALGLDRREYVPVHYGFIPPYEPEVLEETEEYVVARNNIGVVTRALKEGTVGGGRMCMDQYLSFPVARPEDFADVKRRLIAGIPERYAACGFGPPAPDSGGVGRMRAASGSRIDDTYARSIRDHKTSAIHLAPPGIGGWGANPDLESGELNRTCPLVLGENCAANGFYWRAREFMGTEALSYAWFDYPDLMHEMMEFFADFIIETSRPVLEQIPVDYFTLNEDLSMKSGPLLSPATFRTFIFPHLKRMVEFFKGHGVKWFALDTDGDPTTLIPLFMDAGVDVIWPIERASDISPMEWRKRFGRSLRLWGGVDKREIARGPAEIRAHLSEMIPLIEEGGFIPTVDHTVPPDISWDNFRYYMDAKRALLSGDFAKLA